MNGKTERNYGIDLLRLVSMFMVVMLHVLGMGGILQSGDTTNYKNEIFWFLEISCYCAVNVYALISGYVGVNAKHKYSNIINLCLQVIFYAITITAIEIIVNISQGIPLNIKDLLFHFLPTIKRYWYFSSYFCLFFFMPALNSIIKNTSRNTLKVTFIFMFLVFCCYTQFKDKVSGLLNGYSFLWLALLYVIGGYIRKYNPFEKLSSTKNFIFFLLSIIITFISRLAIFFFNAPIGENILVTYTSPTILFAAIFLLNCFAKLKVGINFSKVIAFFAPLAFGVYLIHCHPYLYDNLKGVFSWIINKPIYIGLFIEIGWALAIFVGCLLIDYLRSLLFKVCKIKQFSCWLEKIIGKFFKAILKPLHITFDKEETVEQSDIKEQPEQLASEEITDNTNIN